MTKNNLKVVKSTKDKELEHKEKNKALDAAISQITDNFGKGSVMKLGEQKAMDIESVSTGSLSLDLALGIGGLPKGRIIEIYGPESSGKTTLALQVVAEAQKVGGICGFVDAEHALDPVYAKKLGVNLIHLNYHDQLKAREGYDGHIPHVRKLIIELKELIELGLWTDSIKNQIIKHSGSVQDVVGIPKALKEKYKIVWEIPMKHILEMAADRGAFICQSQSTNLWMKEPTYNKLTAMHFYAWKKGLKTGIYYLRTKAKAAPQQFTIEPDKNNNLEEDDEDCLMCGS